MCPPPPGSVSGSLPRLEDSPPAFGGRSRCLRIMAAVAGAAMEIRPAAPQAEPITPPTTDARARAFDAAPLVALLAFVGGLALYGLTAAPGVQGGDSGEFQFVGYVLGIPHPPGYPLYAVL